MTSIILPVYNEEQRIEKFLPEYLGYLTRNRNSELIIVNDASTDGTEHALIRILKRTKNVRVISEKTRIGKGASIAHGISEAKGKICIYLDADMATELLYINEASAEIENNYNIVIGSRYIDGANVKRDLGRDIFSRCYNFLVKILLNSGLNDHQCGFKAFRRNSILPLLPKIKAKHWSWDTELLVKAQRKGLKIKEMPIEWQEVGGSKFGFISGTFSMAIELGRMFIERISKSG